MKHLGIDFKAIREASGLSIAELARRMETSRSIVWRIEQGYDTQLSTACKFLATCGYDFEPKRARRRRVA